MKSEKISLEETIHEKARQKFNESKRRPEIDDAKESAASDFLYPHFEKLGILDKINKELSYSEA